MRKRLRKKKHLKEFREYGVSLVVEIHDGTEFHAFLDDFILKAVEANGLAFGGGGMTLLVVDVGPVPTGHPIPGRWEPALQNSF